MLVPDDIQQCVVYLGLPVTAAPGMRGMKPSGTAFFVRVEADLPGASFIYLVTAKHVVEKLQGQDFAMRANKKDGGGQFFLGPANVRWWFHPTDDLVDLALIPWAPPDIVQFKTIPTSSFVTDDVLKGGKVGVGSEVLMPGLFVHLAGFKRNIPIVRIGNVAMIPDEPVPTKLGPMEGYLIEARSIGGLSGSPVFVRPDTGGPIYFLGLMHGHWDVPIEERDDMVEVNHDTDAFGKVNMGIAIVVSATKILEVLNQPELQEMRRKGIEKIKRKHPPTLDEARTEGITGEEFEDALKKASRRVEASEPDEASSET